MATKAKKAPAKTAKKSAATKKPATKKPASTKAASAKTTAASSNKTAKKVSEKAKSATVSTSAKTQSARRELTPLEKLRSLHISTVIAYVLLGLLSVFVLTKASAELLLSYQARDSFVQAEGVVLGNASEVLFNVEYRYLLIASLAVAAIGSLLFATWLRKRYERTVTAGISGYRWIIYGVSAAILAELASFMAGIQDIMTLKLVGGLVLLGALLGWLSERENSGVSGSKKLAFYGSVLAYVLAALPVIGSIFGTSFYGDERFGWHVYALVGVVWLGFAATLFVQRSAITAKAKYEYIVFEQRYIRVDQIVKLLAVAILLLALQ